MLRCLLFGHDLEHPGKKELNNGILYYDINDNERRIISCCSRCGKVISYVKKEDAPAKPTAAKCDDERMFGMTEKKGMEMFQRFSDGQKGAQTLISMCTDYLMGNLQTSVFASNLELFSSIYKKYAKQEKEERLHFP